MSFKVNEFDISNYDYDLPAELIAQYPSASREESKLLLADKATHHIGDDLFSNIVNIIDDNSFLVVNNSRVIPARIPANKVTGGKSEVFYISKHICEPNMFYAMVKGNFQPGTKLYSGSTELTLIEKNSDGLWLVSSELSTVKLLQTHGHIPLPPYIQRNQNSDDVSRYQTVYAKNEGSVAAPTAGLHFTPDLLGKIAAIGIPVVEVTLHVGIGTFRPVKTENINEHQMHTELFSINPEAAEAINSYISAGKKLTAVGTTSVRTIESAVGSSGYIETLSGETSLFIKPGYNFKAVKSIITNFHQPRSSLFVLISAFMGNTFAKKCYQHAVENRYRFFSYGDAMFIRN